MVASAAVLLAANWAMSHNAIGADTPARQEADCWDQFMVSKSEEISCAFPTLLEEKDRESLQKLTRQIFKDASCQITIKLDRASIDAAITETDTVYLSPPQPVACEVKTSRGDLPVAFTFAPKIDIKGGKAVKASPGMDHVTGVNSWLAWPVVAYINASGSIQDVMLRVVNAYLERKRTAAAVQ